MQLNVKCLKKPVKGFFLYNKYFFYKFNLKWVTVTIGNCDNKMLFLWFRFVLLVSTSPLKEQTVVIRLNQMINISALCFYGSEHFYLKLRCFRCHALITFLQNIFKNIHMVQLLGAVRCGAAPADSTLQTLHRRGDATWSDSCSAYLPVLSSFKFTWSAAPKMTLEEEEEEEKHQRVPPGWNQHSSSMRGNYIPLKQGVKSQRVLGWQGVKVRLEGMRRKWGCCLFVSLDACCISDCVVSLNTSVITQTAADMSESFSTWGSCTSRCLCFSSGEEAVTGAWSFSCSAPGNIFHF